MQQEKLPHVYTSTPASNINVSMGGNFALPAGTTREIGDVRTGASSVDHLMNPRSPRKLSFHPQDQYRHAVQSAQSRSPICHP